MKQLLLFCALLLALSGCKGGNIAVIGGADGPTAIFIAGKTGSDEAPDDGQTEEKEMVSITMDEARVIFETPGDYIILDVRRADEFAEGHIPGAINIANESISDTPPEGLPKDAKIYVYCRSGNRSKQAARKLIAMGYTDIIEFGGIMDWHGEIEK